MVFFELKPLGRLNFGIFTGQGYIPPASVLPERKFRLGGKGIFILIVEIYRCWCWCFFNNRLLINN